MPETFKNVKLPCYNMVLTERGITSDLTKDRKPCNEHSVNLAYEQYMMDAIESMVLAHHCAGIDVSAPAYVEGIETAVEACWNSL